MAIPAKNVLGNPNVTEGNFQVAIEQLRESVIGSGKAYDSANTYMQYDTCVYNGVTYYSKINSNTGNTPSIGTNWGDVADLISSVVHKTGDETIAGVKTFSSAIIGLSGVYGKEVKMDDTVNSRMLYLRYLSGFNRIDSYNSTATNATPLLINSSELQLQINDLTKLKIDTSGNVLVTNGGLGYGTGNGGTVTQLTSKSTSVMLNKPSGTIILNNSALAQNTAVTFGVSNSIVTASDNIIVSHKSGGAGTGTYEVGVDSISDGAYGIYVKNTGGSSLAESIVLKVDIIKGATA